MDNNKGGGEAIDAVFFQQLGASQLLQTFDLLNDALVWVKDLQGRIMFANQCFLKQYGLPTLAAVVGKYDSDISPAAIAAKFMQDDRRVLQGSPVSERLELNILSTGELCWFSTSKFPLQAHGGDIIGTYGMSRRLDRTTVPLAAVNQLELSVDYIRSNFGKDISIADLAAVSCISVSALERRFKKYLQKSPTQFINEVRLEHARWRLIDSNASIVTIAHESGFTDPSYFTRLFSRHFGCTPSALRRQVRA